MKKIYLVLSLIFIMFMLTLTISASDMYIDAGENVQIVANENVFYLPSHISPYNVKIDFFSGSPCKYENTNGEIVKLESGSFDLTPYKKSDNTYVLKTYDLGIETIYVFYFGSSLPSMFVETTKGAENIISRNGEDEESLITIFKSNGTLEYKDTEFSEIKVRGNTTNSYAKKPFQIKLENKQSLFGMAQGKNWILLANYLDQSLIRNSIMFRLAELLGMKSSDFQSIDLYIDGQYYGIYLLCEKVQVSKSRVDIFDLEKATDLLNPTYKDSATKVTSGKLIDETILVEYSYVEGVVNPTDITGGYLIELDNNYYKNELCYFKTENNAYVLKSPEYASKEQVEYIARLFAEMEEAIMSADGKNSIGKHYSEYIDIDSFVYAYIIAEYSRNYDAGSSSMYFYKDIDVNGTQSKIFKGPLWDCDNTLGNILKNGASNTEGFWAKNRSIWAGLTKKAEFNQKVTEEFARLYDSIIDMISAGGYVESLVKELGSSIEMERNRWRSNDYTYWPLYYDGIHYDRWQSSQVFNFVKDYSNGIDGDDGTVIGYLCEHMENRANYLATEWGCNVELRERVLNSEEDVTPNPTPDPTPNPDQSQGTENNDGNNGNNNTVLVIVCVASILVALCAIVALIVVIKKKK